MFEARSSPRAAACTRVRRATKIFKETHSWIHWLKSFSGLGWSGPKSWIGQSVIGHFFICEIRHTSLWLVADQKRHWSPWRGMGASEFLVKALSYHAVIDSNHTISGWKEQSKVWECFPRGLCCDSSVYSRGGKSKKGERSLCWRNQLDCAQCLINQLFPEQLAWDTASLLLSKSYLNN